jgi:anhydro-N-acetylmuramic acid kinase
MDGFFIGLMSGTSLDGIDGVLCAFEVGSEPVRVLAHAHLAITPELARELLALNSPGHDELHRAAIAANQLARLSAEVVDTLLKQAAVRREQVLAIGAHGQTVRHRPGEFDVTGYTLQLNAPALLAELSGVGVIADFRSRDVAAEGQGAPLVPAFHRAVFARDRDTVGVLNIGGIANLSVLGPEETVGFDCGPGNALMDHWCRLHTGRPYDDRGAWAASGVVDTPLLADMLSQPYFSRLPPKSTGRDLFNATWLNACLLRHAAPQPLRPEDVQATLVELTAAACALAVVKHAPACSELLICGGGALNTHLTARLTDRLPGIDVAPTDLRGLPAMQVEACAFAWLARAWMARQPGNLSQVTGAKGPRVLGALYPA